MTVIELSFPVLGESLPTDHAYPLYGALSSRLPLLHDNALPLSIGHISGSYAGRGRLQLDGRSRLRLRLPAEQIAMLLPLAGQSLDVAGHRLRLGVPQVRSLEPANWLVARLVTIKFDSDVCVSDYADQFLAAAKKLLGGAGIGGDVSLPRTPVHSKRAEEPQRRILRIQGRTVVGFALAINGLSEADSLAIQANWRDERPIFSRRKLGCGFFLPMREGGIDHGG